MSPSSCVTPAGASTSLTSRINGMTTHTNTHRRGVYSMISLHHADQKNADGNSNLTTTSHKLGTYFAANPIKLRREEDIKKKKRHNNTGSQERVLTHVRTVWSVWRKTVRRRRYDAAAVYYGYLYHPSIDKDDTYVNNIFCIMLKVSVMQVVLFVSS